MELSLLQIVVLAVVQGVTEFLPISSSGHLVIVAGLMAPDGNPAHFDVADVSVMLHAGTLLSIVVFYWQRLWRLLGADRRALLVLLVGSIPAAVIGITVELKFASLLENALLAGCMLPLTGVVLLLADRAPLGEKNYARLGVGRALAVGFAQAVALLPGVSRSGMTISAGIGVGLSREQAAAFSFLLAVPTIGGAALLKVKTLAEATGPTTPPLHLAIGMAVSFVVGLVSLWWLVRWLQTGRLHLFAWWCIPVGVAVIVWQLLGS